MGIKRSVDRKQIVTDEVANTDGELPTPEIFDRRGVQIRTQEASAQAKEVLGDLSQFKSPTKEQIALVQQVMLASQQQWAHWEAERKKITVPLDAAKTAVQELFKPVLTRWAEVERRAKDMIGAFIDAEEARKKADALAAAEAFKAGEASAVVQALVTASGETTELIKGVGNRKQWYAEVTDSTSLIRAVLEGTAPKNLVIIDDSALQAFARATAGTAELPGVKFDHKTVVSGSGRS